MLNSDSARIGALEITHEFLEGWWIPARPVEQIVRLDERMQDPTPFAHLVGQFPFGNQLDMDPFFCPLHRVDQLPHFDLGFVELRGLLHVRVDSAVIYFSAQLPGQRPQDLCDKNLQ